MGGWQVDPHPRYGARGQHRPAVDGTPAAIVTTAAPPSVIS
eukprot:COSAG01_NODE_1452_length_10260_cov_26.827970_5_plen_41_part_00